MPAPAPEPSGVSPELVAAMVAYQARVATLRARLTKFVQRSWRSLGSWRGKDIPGFVGAVVPVVAGAQRQVLALTVANLAVQQQLALGGRFTPVPVDPRHVTGAAARNGTDPREVYERPFHLTWRQLDTLPREAGSVDKAIEAGMNRAVLNAVTDVQLTKVQTAQQVIGTNTNVVGYRRQLEGPHSCGLCIVASTQRYHKAELLPIHPACDCAVVPIMGGENVDLTIDPELLAAAHQRIEDAFGRSSSAARVVPGARVSNGDVVRYRDVLISHEHGELGKVLAVKGRPFLGPHDL